MFKNKYKERLFHIDVIVIGGLYCLLYFGRYHSESVNIFSNI